ncbi:Transglutaminase-like superfamily protein [Roseovarius sp. THAF8]|nr:Transglutaminase-like superfamily protein [Roseovarius sp. THAF8]
MSDPMHLHIKHITRYRFSGPVTYGLQQLRKTPKTTRAQQILTWSTSIENGRKEADFTDHHNNAVELISFDRDTTELTVTSQGEVVLEDVSGVLGRHLGPAPLWLYEQATKRTEAKSGARALIRKVDEPDPLDRLHALSKTIRDSVAFQVGASEPSWSAEDAISHGKGVCQDHTHIFLACARAMGFPARYVSGYLMLDDRTAQDAMHAWAEAHVEALGWVGFDISNGISPDTRYVRVATGLDYADAAPITGTRIGGPEERLEVEIDVIQQ